MLSPPVNPKKNINQRLAKAMLTEGDDHTEKRRTNVRSMGHKKLRFGSLRMLEGKNNKLRRQLKKTNDRLRSVISSNSGS